MTEKPQALPPLGDWDVLVGRVTGVHGLRGEVRVTSLSDDPERFAPGSKVCLVPREGDRALVTIAQVRRHKKQLLVRFAGFGSRDAAETLRQASLTIAREMRRPLPPGHYYIDDLLGLSVRTSTGRDLGTIVEVLETSANAVYVTPRAMIPATREVVLEVDVAGKRMLVADVPGLER